MMAGMLTQLPLPLLPAGAAEIAPGVGLVAGADGGGLVSVHGLATFAWDGGDEAGRRLAAVQLVRLRAVSQAQAAAAFGVDPVTVWRWDQALAAGGVAGLVPARRGPKGASKLTPELAARIRDLDAAGATLAEIAAATGVSTFSVRNALGRVPGGRPAAGAAEDSAGLDAGDDDAGQGAVAVLPDPVPRDAERALARWGLLGEGAAPVFTAGARYPLAGLLLALPALEGTGLLDAARQVYGRLKDGCCGLGATLLTLVFLALAGEPRAEGATRVPPAALGRVLGLDRAPEVKTIRRKLGELAAAGKAADLIMARECQILCARVFSPSGSGCLSGTFISHYLEFYCPVYSPVSRNPAYPAPPGRILRVRISLAVPGHPLPDPARIAWRLSRLSLNIADGDHAVTHFRRLCLFIFQGAGGQRRGSGVQEAGVLLDGLVQPGCGDRQGEVQVGQAVPAGRVLRAGCLGLRLPGQGAGDRGRAGQQVSDLLSIERVERDRSCGRPVSRQRHPAPPVFTCGRRTVPATGPPSRSRPAPSPG